MIKGSINQEDITIVNIYAPNTRAPKYIKQILGNPKREIDNNRIIVGDINMSLTAMDKLYSQKINKEVLELNHL